MKHTFCLVGVANRWGCQEAQFWKPVIDRIIARLSSWNNKFLSFVGRLVLLKSVMSSLLVYRMSKGVWECGG